MKAAVLLRLGFSILVFCSACAKTTAGLSGSNWSSAHDRQQDAERVSPTNLPSELPFRLVSGFLIEVSGAIAGRTGFKFVLDTGSTVSMLDSHIAEQLRLSFYPLKLLAWVQR